MRQTVHFGFRSTETTRSVAQKGGG